VRVSSLLILTSAMIFSSVSYAADPGKTAYLNLCASCHGKGGKGDGPVGKFLKRTPADLTRIAIANNGVFPSERVYETIDGRKEVGAHGTREMPVWGIAALVSPAFTRARINAVVEYLATLQAK
jgi:mono/diheme cytochrome c family protein